MKSKILILFLGASISLSQVFSASQSADWAEVAEADLLLMGDYEGKWLNPPEDSYQFKNPMFTAQVANIDVGRYYIHFFQDFDRRANRYFEGEGKLVGDEIVVNEKGWKFTVSKDGLKGVRRISNNDVEFSMKRVIRVSPTLGAKPPKGAIALFDGSDFDEWEHEDGRAVTWKLIGDGAMEIEPGSEHREATPKIGGLIQSKRKFKDVIFHMEFRYPVEPGKSGQGRGNSGLFFQGEYEAQILNSYALNGKWNELGALYKMSPPKVNAARPPMQWQTYDVKYRAPRYKDGKLVENARISVDLNGTTVQKDEEIIHGTEYEEKNRWKTPPSEPGSIELQDHSNRIQFRNIWIQEVNLD